MALEARESVHVECYVRSQLPGPVAERANTIVGRLRRLRDHDRLDSFRVVDWPPVHRHLEYSVSEPTRDELVRTFERWADRSEVTLEPAFRRRESLSSPLEGDELHGRLRVPVVALAVYDDVGPSETLCGVVPYTEPREQGQDRTVTVADWLAAVEPPELTGQVQVPKPTT
ncbi:hypothetical protein D8Y22_00710 [Salinadaptatus halalkaliphilus]|uniref:Uncharacterized protein n=2 Tax=Salinadaptatus halalkaliphilus TaxID=2419781 RepID=A0A4S3TQU9_9EURY|nr:hypothetical protein D8Y22_00710 [Salinadaptatus halalkaliphilus]